MHNLCSIAPSEPASDILRDRPPFHPLAEMFPLMERAAFDELVADIAGHGLNESIVLYDHKILDGRNRERACHEAGVEPRYRHYSGDYASALAFVISANIHRRHLTPKQKRQIVEDLIRAKPEASSRQIADMAKISPTTATKIRHQMEERGDVSTLDTSTDTRGRQQPRTKAKTPAQEQQLDSIKALLAAQRQAEALQLLSRVYQSRATKISAEPVTRSPAHKPSAAGLNSMAFVDAPPAAQTRYLDAIGAKPLLAALPLNWIEEVRAWLVARDARPPVAAPVSNADGLDIPGFLLRAPVSP